MSRAWWLTLAFVAGCGDEIPVGPAIYCWDLNADATCDLGSEDQDGDGSCDVSDCRGPAGAVGSTGSTGPAGADGIAGPQGAQGDLGPTGPAGEIGPAGAAGAAGAPGDPGPIGPPGAVGPPGAPGADGDDGVACWDRDADGLCNPIAEDTTGDSLCTVDDCRGPVGPPGPPGPAGQDGSPDTPAEVLAKLLTVDGVGSGLDADRLDGIDAATLLGRFAAIEARLDDAEEPVSVLGVTAFTTDGSAAHAGLTGLAAIRQVCVDEFGTGARACSFADYADAVANATVPGSVVGVTVWLPRDTGPDLAACNGMTTTGANALALALDASGAITFVAGLTCGGTHPILCCRGFR